MENRKGTLQSIIFDFCNDWSFRKPEAKALCASDQDLCCLPIEFTDKAVITVKTAELEPAIIEAEVR